MSERFALPVDVDVHGEVSSDPCYRYAAAELQRLLERLGVACRFRRTRAPGRGLCLGLADRGMPAPRTAPASAEWDGYAIEVTSRGVAIAAPTAKGVLNGVYDLAERLGVLFLLPGDDGEWLPEGGPRPLAVGRRVHEPRFPFRGVFFYPMADDYPIEAWLRFYAKLRFNNVGDHGCTVAHPRVWPRMAEFGLRHEAGGHGLASLVARDLFQTEPDRFRMSQPEDFGGKRANDLNFCVTNPANRRLIRKGFRQALRAFAGLHAVHVYADDLPGGGWCYCPSCRALTPSDQNLLAMRYLAEAAAEAGVPARIPCVAYHDTLFPGATIPPAPACSLLFAPRERCYGHALNDPACAKNRHHLAALRAWRDVFRGLDDAHTFEYYFDQILFRGLYPYLPHVILGDLAAYRAHGIEACLALQIAGPALAPDYNMLLFARAHWDAGVTAASFARDLARAVLFPPGSKFLSVISFLSVQNSYQ